MKFPGRRKSKHYFPVNENGRIAFDYNFHQKGSVYVVGIDQFLVDIEVEVTEEFLAEHNIPKGESILLGKELAENLCREFREKNLITGLYAGGAVGNTLHNYSVLSDDQSFALGCISENIKVGGDAFNYICNTNSHVDFSNVCPIDGELGRAICFITPDRERTFGVAKGIMNELDQKYIPEKLITGAACLLISCFLLRDETSPIFASTMKAVKLAKKSGVPIILAMGTAILIEQKKEFFLKFIEEYINVVALNSFEATALTGFEDPLKAGEQILEITDLILLTVGPSGLYLCGHVDDQYSRQTTHQLHTKSIIEYNKYEYSRAMKKSKCKNAVKIYAHMNPYLGGPGTIKNTNGAGDAALAGLMHDMVANSYHRKLLPNATKHIGDHLLYSSLRQVCKYSSRISYEVLKQNSPRLSHGLPEKEDSLKESYWEK